MKNLSFECRGFTCAAPKRGATGRNTWGAGFTQVWGPLANRPTRSKGK